MCECVCVCVCVCVCIGSMRESVRGAEEKTQKKKTRPSTVATAAESPGEQHFKKTSREIKSACRPERRPLAGRERKLNRNEKTEHVERSCFGVSCYVTETVDAKNGKVKSIFEKKKKKKKEEKKKTTPGLLAPTQLQPPGRI